MQDASAKERSMSIVGREKDGAAMKVSLKNMREELWEAMQDMKEGKISPEDLRIILNGCKAFMQTVKLEMDIFRFIEELG